MIKKATTTKIERHNNAVKFAEQGIVLLRNKDNILPLKKNKICVIGELSQNPTIGGEGSSFVESQYKQIGLVNILRSCLPESEIKYVADYKNGANYTSDFVFNFKAAIIEEYKSDIAIVYVGNNIFEETESLDRHSLKLSPNQKLLINEVAKANPETIVIINTGSAIDMTNWIKNVKGAIYAGYADEGINEALANILSGKAVPCGKLNETFPLCLDDTFVKDNRGNGFYDTYHDGIMVGYRYYDYKNLPVLFEFGYGLSYAQFEYSNLIINKIFELEYIVIYDIENLSDFDAKEISQLYVKDVFAMVERPLKELKSFSKELIKAHEVKQIKINLNADSFSYFSNVYDKYYVENGFYEIMIGASSKDIKLTGKIEINLNENT